MDEVFQLDSEEDWEVYREESEHSTDYYEQVDETVNIVRKEVKTMTSFPKKLEECLQTEWDTEIFQEFLSKIAQRKDPLHSRRQQVVTRLEDISGSIRLLHKRPEDRRKLHREHLLSEMEWMANDFETERRRHFAAARKSSRSVENYFKNMEQRRIKQQKEYQLALRHQASKVAREARYFWQKINKIVVYKQKLESEKARRKAMDKHLSFLVEQTERYSSMLADSLLEGVDAEDEKGTSNSETESSNMEKETDSEASTQVQNVKEEINSDEEESFQHSSPLRQLFDGAQIDKDQEGGNSDTVLEAERFHLLEAKTGDEGDDEFSEQEPESDIEDAIAEAEALDLQEEGGQAKELDLLKLEGEMSLEELKCIYGLQEKDVDSELLSNVSSEPNDEGNADDLMKGDEGDDEFSEKEPESDIEDTIAEAEVLDLEQEGGHTKELDLLKLEGEMSLDELKRMYGVQEKEKGSKALSNASSEPNKDEDGDDFMKGDEGDGEFSEQEPESDIEDTIAEAEKLDLEEEGNQAKELNLLKLEGEMSLDELKHMYGVQGNEKDSKVLSNVLSEPGDDEDADDLMKDDEFSEQEPESDIEDTIAEAEVLDLEEEGSQAKELDLLKLEGDMSLDELKRVYGLQGKEKDSKVLSNVDNPSQEDPMEEEINNEEDALARIAKADERMRHINVNRPFLLSRKLKLRVYQQIGLNWLVSLHERRLNGILADEMGLGKTIQTLSMLAYLACYRGIWGPHLIVVPTSCIVNWESELKRWVPGFKVLTYYGSAKTRKTLRQGWTRPNAFHVCVTSYQLAVLDAQSFRRKRWYYLILDEAHNIKNFKSQRWQTMLNFSTARRLLLTGTPLQNNLMELWSLMHFLMPHIFRSRKEFSYWFSNPLNTMVEGGQSVSEDLIRRLHQIMRPFLLRRLKKDVEKQLPGKYEHIVMVKLSKRQQQLYEEFMARSSTRAALVGGNFMGMMNVLMQLRKVCNHPDLFEARPIKSPFLMPSVTFRFPSMCIDVVCPSEYQRAKSGILPQLWPLNQRLGQYDRARIRELCVSRMEWIGVQDQNLPVPSPRQVNDSAISQYLSEVYSLALKAKRTNRIFTLLLNNTRCLIPDCSLASDTVAKFTLDGVDPIKLAFDGKVNARSRLDSPVTLLNLLNTPEERSLRLKSTIQRFICFVPRCLVNRSSPEYSRYSMSRILCRKRFEKKMLQCLHGKFDAYYASACCQNMYFPERRLVQFDSGKLQVLAILLRKLKIGKHRCLIFTQMSKMLDILEEFLTLHGYLYVRLDGSTGVERRQRLMDRFNSDERIFCFILSTRSGGLGINLTGADTVVFYDSDWNPAMDAQAQDRAHRIGQTRDVHIYRLVCKSSIEENILKKAQQKQQLDYLVMTEGNFSTDSLFNQSSLKEMLGAVDDGAQSMLHVGETLDKTEQPSMDMSAADVEAAMAQFEDEDDAKATSLAKKELADEMEEFDEDAIPKPEEVDEEGTPLASSQQTDVTPIPSETENEKEEEDPILFQGGVAPDMDKLEKSLRPVEKYALEFKANLEPSISFHLRSEQQRLHEVLNDQTGNEWDMAEIEEQKIEDECRHMESGDLLVTSVRKPNAEQYHKMFQQERLQLLTERIKRQVNGSEWEKMYDASCNLPFWLNQDTGETTWSMPKVLQAQRAFTNAKRKRYNGLPDRVMLNLMKFLCPWPERKNASETCRRWADAARHESFVKVVLPVESWVSRENSLFAQGHGVYKTLPEAIEEAESGDTIVLEQGHFWLEVPMKIEKKLRLIGEGGDPASVVIEMTGSLDFHDSGVLYGFSVRRPQKCKNRGSCISSHNGTLQIYHCKFNNDGAGGAALTVDSGAFLRMDHVLVEKAHRSAIFVACGEALVTDCQLVKNGQAGIVIVEGGIVVADSHLTDNCGPAIQAHVDSFVHLEFNDLRRNLGGPLDCEGHLVMSDRNLCDEDHFGFTDIIGLIPENKVEELIATEEKAHRFAQQKQPAGKCANEGIAKLEEIKPEEASPKSTSASVNINETHQELQHPADDVESKLWSHLSLNSVPQPIIFDFEKKEKKQSLQLTQTLGTNKEKENPEGGRESQNIVESVPPLPLHSISSAQPTPLAQQKCVSNGPTHHSENSMSSSILNHAASQIPLATQSSGRPAVVPQRGRKRGRPPLDKKGLGGRNVRGRTRPRMEQDGEVGGSRDKSLAAPQICQQASVKVTALGPVQPPPRGSTILSPTKLPAPCSSEGPVLTRPPSSTMPSVQRPTNPPRPASGNAPPKPPLSTQPPHLIYSREQGNLQQAPAVSTPLVSGPVCRVRPQIQVASAQTRTQLPHQPSIPQARANPTAREMSAQTRTQLPYQRSTPQVTATPTAREISAQTRSQLSQQPSISQVTAPPTAREISTQSLNNIPSTRKGSTMHQISTNKSSRANHVIDLSKDFGTGGTVSKATPLPASLQRTAPPNSLKMQQTTPKLLSTSPSKLTQPPRAADARLSFTETQQQLGFIPSLARPHFSQHNSSHSTPMVSPVISGQTLPGKMPAAASIPYQPPSLPNSQELSSQLHAAHVKAQMAAFAKHQAVQQAYLQQHRQLKPPAPSGLAYLGRYPPGPGGVAPALTPRSHDPFALQQAYQDPLAQPHTAAVVAAPEHKGVCRMPSQLAAQPSHSLQTYYNTLQSYQQAQVQAQVQAQAQAQRQHSQKALEYWTQLAQQQQLQKPNDSKSGNMNNIHPQSNSSHEYSD